MKSSRPYLEIYVIFLKTIVPKSNVDDWGKLRRMLRFVCCTIKGKRAFVATNLDKICIWVYLSYAVHTDMKIHTEGVMSIGLGVTH